MPRLSGIRPKISTLEPERYLWRAVIMQAISDALYMGACSKGGGNVAPMHGDRAAANWWLDPSVSGFVDVCDMAGVDPSAVMRYYEKRKKLLKKDGDGELK